MNHFAIFKSEKYGFNQEQVMDHISTIVTAYDSLEKKYFREKEKNRELREQVRVLENAREQQRSLSGWRNRWN